MTSWALVCVQKKALTVSREPRVSCVSGVRRVERGGGRPSGRYFDTCCLNNLGKSGAKALLRFSFPDYLPRCRFSRHPRSRNLIWNDLQASCRGLHSVANRISESWTGISDDSACNIYGCTLSNEFLCSSQATGVSKMREDVSTAVQQSSPRTSRGAVGREGARRGLAS